MKYGMAFVIVCLVVILYWLTRRYEKDAVALQNQVTYYRDQSGNAHARLQTLTAESVARFDSIAQVLDLNARQISKLTRVVAALDTQIVVPVREFRDTIWLNDSSFVVDS